MRVSDLTRQKPTRVVVDLGDGDTIDLSFDRNRVTPAWVTLAQKRDEEQDTLALPKALADVILSWDVLNDDGSDFEPSAENLAVLAYPAQRCLLEEILQAAVPSRAEGNGSGSISGTAGPVSTSLPESPPNGHQPSSSAQLSASQSQT